MSETDLQRAIQQALSWLPGVRCWRCNSGATKGGKVRYGLRDLRGEVAGTPDLILMTEKRVVCPECAHRLIVSGVLGGLEVKTPNGRTNAQRAAAQLLRRDEIRRFGGIAAQVRSVAEAVRVIEEARR